MTKCLIVEKQTNKVKNETKEKHSHEFNNLIEENIGFSMYMYGEMCYFPLYNNCTHGSYPGHCVLNLHWNGPIVQKQCQKISLRNVARI